MEDIPRDIYGTDEVPAYAATARQSDYSNLPPAYTSVCTGEPFYCETLAFVENLRAAGVEVGLDVYEGPSSCSLPSTPRRTRRPFP